MATLKILERKEWGALAPKRTTPMIHPILEAIFSYIEVRDLVDMQIVKKAQQLHMDVKGFDDIECSFVIGRDGTIYEGRGWFNQPEERDSTNGGNYLDIAFIGRVKGKPGDDPSLIAMLELLQFGVDNRYLDENFYMIGNNFPKQFNERMKCNEEA